MNHADLENRLRRAAVVATPSRSIADRVMSRLADVPAATLIAKPSAGRWSVRFAGIAACTAIAASLVAIVFLGGPGVRVTLADVRMAVTQQKWVHVRYDAGQLKEMWTNLQTGEVFCSRFDGNIVYINDAINKRLVYWKGSGSIAVDQPIIYAPGTGPSPWTPQTAWEEFVAPYVNAVAASQSAGVPDIFDKSVRDRLNNVDVRRFDHYSVDAVGKRFLFSQLWADPRTHLPLRIETHLQFGDRERSGGKEWSVGDYDFPESGPKDLYALGVPRDTPTAKENIIPADLQPVIEAVTRNHDAFLKSYRAIVVVKGNARVDPVDRLAIIWRDGDLFRRDYHLPAWELQNDPNPPLPEPTAQALLTWGMQHWPIDKDLMDQQRDYTWTMEGKSGLLKKPQVNVTLRTGRSLLSQDLLPESIQWPTYANAFYLQRLNDSAEKPAGCIAVRSDGGGDSRIDYFFDPKNDCVCMKSINWQKRGEQWCKNRETTLDELHRVGGRTVAGLRVTHQFADPVKGFGDYTETTTIDVVPMKTDEFPKGIFDPASLTNGADVIGY